MVVCMMITNWAVPGQSLEIVSPEVIYQYQLGPSTLVNVAEDLYAHELIIADPSGQPIDRMRWSDHASAWDRGFVYKDTLVLMGTLGTSAEVVSVLNTASKQPMLFALCRTPSFSPSGRYIGYGQFIPRSLEGALDDIVLVLDLEHLPAIESSSDVSWVVNSTNVGTAVYPRAYLGKQRFYGGAAAPDGPSPHLVMLPLAWDAKRDVMDVMVVVSKIADQWLLASVDLTAGIAQRKLMERRLDVRQFLLEQSDDPVVVQRAQKELRINHIDVEDGMASISAAPIANIPLRTVVVPLR